MKKLEISTKDLLKAWTNEDLIEALTSARQRSAEAWEDKTVELWAQRAEAYAEELNRRAN